MCDMLNLSMDYVSFYVVNVCVCLPMLCTHPESCFHLDLAVCSGALQREELVQSQVGSVEETTQGQVENTELRLLLVVFNLDHENTNIKF